MLPYTDPQTHLELHRQRVAELIREAADRQRVRTATTGRHRRFGRWRRRAETPRTPRTAAA